MRLILAPFVLVWFFLAMGVYMKLSYYLSPRIGSGWADFWGILAALTYVVLSVYILLRLIAWWANRKEVKGGCQ